MVLDEPREGDEIVHVDGLTFVYRPDDRDLLQQTVIDYKDSWYGEGFTVCSPRSEPC
jgi:Fe-S cluster assembly iron-binding protein IscA